MICLGLSSREVKAWLFYLKARGGGSTRQRATDDFNARELRQNNRRIDDARGFILRFSFFLDE